MAVAALKPPARVACAPAVAVVLHGLMAVAALKLAALMDLERRGLVVLHGLMAVAALKRPARDGVGGGTGVLHGLMAVAALKPRPAQYRRSCGTRSPRPHGRGRIEAAGDCQLRVEAGVFSTASWPWPH